MAYRTAVVERCGIKIVKRDTGRRVVFGEVMLPCPDLERGQKVQAEELRGRVHFDGGCMMASEIQQLVDRFAIRRPAIDVEHDGLPRAATVVESFIAQRGWEPWTEGAWVAGVQIHDEALWERTGVDLHAYSIQFVVRVEDVPIVVVGDDGEERDVVLHVFSDGHPQFLSLVAEPATGAMWKIKQRGATVPGIAAVVDREWDADEAFRRVQDWAGDDIGKAIQAYAMYDGADFKRSALIADIDGGGRLVVVRSALEAARRTVALSNAEAEDRKRALQLIGRFDGAEVNRGVVDFQDLPLADVERGWDAGEALARVVAWAGGDEWDPEKVRRAHVWYDSDNPEVLASYKLPLADIVDGTLTAIPRAIFAAAARLNQTDVPAADLNGIRNHLGRYYDKMEREAPWDEEGESASDDDAGEAARADADDDETTDSSTFTDFLTADAGSVFDGADALARALTSVLDGDEGVGMAKAMVNDFAAWALARIDEVGVATFAEDMSGATDDDMRSESDRATPSFNALVNMEDMEEKVWRATYALREILFNIASDTEVTNKPGAMRQAIGEFAAWMDSLVGKLEADGLLAALSAPPDGDVDRKGAKMAKKRLEQLTTLVEQLQALVAELQPAVDAVGEAAGEDDEETDEPARAAAPPVADAETSRSTADDDPEGDDKAALLEQIEQQQTQMKELQQRLEAVETARGAPSSAEGVPVLGASQSRNPYEILSPLMGLNKNNPQGD